MALLLLNNNHTCYTAKGLRGGREEKGVNSDRLRFAVDPLVRSTTFFEVDTFPPTPTMARPTPPLGVGDHHRKVGVWLDRLDKIRRLRLNFSDRKFGTNLNECGICKCNIEQFMRRLDDLQVTVLSYTSWRLFPTRKYRNSYRNAGAYVLVCMRERPCLFSSTCHSFYANQDWRLSFFSSFLIEFFSLFEWCFNSRLLSIWNAVIAWFSKNVS